MNIKEIWKDVPQYEGMYQVSNFGAVKSMSRLTPHGHKRKERILKPRTNFSYLSYTLSKDKNKKVAFSHCLVMLSFSGKKEVGMVVDHIDGNPRNNYHGNLQYVTQRENIRKSTQHLEEKTSKYVGVGKIGNRWRARYYNGGKLVHIGCYLTQEQASLAYEEKIREVANVI